MRLPALCLGFTVALSLLAGCGRDASRSQVLHYEKSQYQEIYVVEDERRRCLQFAPSHLNQSCFDPDDPLVLQMPYTRAMMVGLFARPAPTRVLMIGLGGASIVRALRALDPSMRIDVAELDPAVVRIAESYFGLDRDAGTQVFIEDGRAFVERQQRAGAPYDLVLLDAFDADYIPGHLRTVEFLRSVQAVLVPGGAVVANTFVGGPLPVRETATYRAVFAEVYQVVAGRNRILLAGASLAPMQQMRDNAQRLEQALQRFGVSAASLADRLEPVPRSDARPFTDRGEPARVKSRRRTAPRRADCCRFPLRLNAQRCCAERFTGGKMAELVVVGIDNAYDADRILADMNNMDAGRTHELDTQDGVAGLLITNPSIDSALGGSLRASGNDISESLSDCGMEQGFVLSLAEMLEADAAALFLVVHKSQTGKVLEGLSDYPGRVLRSSLSADQVPRLHRALSRVHAAPR